MSRMVLVTGGCGFIGTSLVAAGLQHGDRIRVLDNMAHPAEADDRMCSGAELLEGDIRDEAVVAHALSGVDAVIHLAASGSVIQSIADPRYNFDVNAYGTLTLLRQAVESGVRKFIFASTGGALIGDAVPPVNETSLPKPISPYGAGKLSGEAYCHAFARSYGLPTVALRFANVYGPHSAHKAGAVTAFIKALLSGDPIVIYGDGSASRDFLYVDDLCRGILQALDTDLEPGTVLHLASGVETTISQLASTLAEVAGRPDHPVRHEPARRGEVVRNFATYDRAREAIGFAPQTDLRAGLTLTWEWFRQQQMSVLMREATDA